MTAAEEPLRVVPGLAVWMPHAGSKLGEHEFPGEAANPFVVECLSLCRQLPPGMMHSDETAWCSAFVNWCMKQAGLRYTESAAASSWLSWGQELSLHKPLPWGAILVFRREGGHHVAFNEGERGSDILVLGGNQENMVSSAFRSRSLLMGARWPSTTSLFG